MDAPWQTFFEIDDLIDIQREQFVNTNGLLSDVFECLGRLSRVKSAEGNLS